jgi:hypothetical protein
MRSSSIALLAAAWIVDSVRIAHAQSRDLNASVVQLRIGVARSGFGCAAGILVSPRLIVTAGHVLPENVEWIGVSTRSSPDEKMYSVIGEEASAQRLGDEKSFDVGVIELASDWSGALPNSFPTLVRASPDELNGKFSVYTFHNDSKPETACKGVHQGKAQGFHATAIQVVNTNYKRQGGKDRIRVQPALDEAYSGSALLMEPCGKLPSCVVAIQSKTENDAGELSSMLTSLAAPAVSQFLQRDFDIELHDFVDARTVPGGWSLSLNALGHAYSGERLRGFSAGGEIAAGYFFVLDRLQTIGTYAGLALSEEWFTSGSIDAIIRSPDESWEGSKLSSDVARVLGFEARVGLEAWRDRMVPLRVLVGWYAGSYALASGPSFVEPVWSTAWTLHVGTRWRTSERLFFDFGFVGRKLELRHHGARYTVVPGEVDVTAEKSDGFSVGVEAALGLFVGEQWNR